MNSWNSSHGSRGCSQDPLKASGGAGLFYCFAAQLSTPLTVRSARDHDQPRSGPEPRLEEIRPGVRLPRSAGRAQRLAQLLRQLGLTVRLVENDRAAREAAALGERLQRVA